MSQLPACRFCGTTTNNHTCALQNLATRTATPASEVEGLVERLEARSSTYSWDSATYFASDADMMRQAANTLADQQAQLKTILDREAATIARYDAKLDAKDAENERLVEMIRDMADAFTVWAGPHDRMSEGAIRAYQQCADVAVDKLNAARAALAQETKT